MRNQTRCVRLLFVAALLASACAAVAQQPAVQQPATQPPANCLPRGFIAPPAYYQSVEVLPDRRVSFRVCAPAATEVRVTSNDIAEVIPMGPGANGLPLAMDAMGLWSVTTAKPVPPDTYRFNFSVNGARVPDPQGTTFTRTQFGINSTFEVLGPEGAFQTYDRNVPHGMVSMYEYWSKSLGVKRRAHVYTPPGYLTSSRRYPVLYLVHGAGDSDDSWTAIGRAHHILDNLIAAGKAKAMIIVMPFGHTPDRPGTDLLANNDFGDDLLKDLMPKIEHDFRTINKPDSRAMAGLSMGGAHTLRNGLTHPELFHHIGIFSMGLGVSGPGAVAAYESEHAAVLKRDAKEMKLLYYAVGKDDFLYGSVAPTRALLDKYGIEHVYNESGGDHTWINWRRYLNDFAPRLFQ